MTDIDKIYELLDHNPQDALEFAEKILLTTQDVSLRHFEESGSRRSIKELENRLQTLID